MRHIIFFMSLVMLCSCGNRTQNMRTLQAKNLTNMYYQASNFTEINLDKHINLSVPEFKSKVSDIKYVYLKTEEPIGQIDQLLVHENKIYIADRHLSRQIFIFDMEGNLIKLISDMGGGPKEYLGVGDIAINNDMLILHDSYGGFMLFYTLYGEFIKKTRTISGRHMLPLNDKFIFSQGYRQDYSNNTTILAVANGDTVVSRAFPYQNIQKRAASGEELKMNNGEVFFMPSLCDTVYRIINDSTYTIKYVIQHKKSVWKKYNENLDYHEVGKLVKEGYNTSFNTDFVETAQHAHIHLVENNNILRSYWYDKLTGKVYYCSGRDAEKGNITDNNVPPPIAVWNNYNIGFIVPEWIEAVREYVKTLPSDTLLKFDNPEYGNIIYTDDDPNQALVFYKLDFNK